MGRPPRVLRRDHACSAGFLDETGAISRDRFFGVGLLKASEPSRVLRRIQKLRDRKHWYKEIKFSETTADSLGLYKAVADECLEQGDVEFFCFISDREKADPVARFGTTWDAYSKLAEQLVCASLRSTELMSLLADNYSTPDSVLFEEDLRSRVNKRLRGLGLVSVCRLDSRASDGLQLADLLTSAVAFEFRADAGLASKTSPKAKLAAHVRQQMGTPSCLGGWRNSRHSVAMYHHGSWTPDEDGKGASVQQAAPVNPGVDSPVSEA
ncbi:DUF3800 domain-containing protein [Amycolatopsis nivea]